MRRILLALVVVATPVSAQRFPTRNPETPRAWLSLGDGIGVAAAGGAVGGSSSVSQVMRASATAYVFRDHGLDVTVFRVQTVLPASGRFSDPDFDNPEGDGIVLSYASIAAGRRADIPAVFTVGAGVIRRSTTDPNRSHDTWVARLAYDADPSLRFWGRADLTVGAGILIMPARNGQSYVATFGAALRVH